LKNKFLDYALLFAALSISCTAALYSINGLTSIFSGAFVAVVIMGISLEISKVILTLFLHENWNRTKILLRIYLVLAIIILMTITSIGIFGFLSKAHIAQSLTGDSIQSNIEIFDRQINTLQSEKQSDENTLKQLDNAITQIISSSTNENGATKALTVRNSQQKERSQINSDIQDKQNQINQLQQKEAPIKLELQKNSVDVGPIKYIAEMLYGDNPNQNLLDRAVRWMIILLVIVFDPLALSMLLAFDLHKSSEITESPVIKHKRTRKLNKNVDSLIKELLEAKINVDQLNEEERNAVAEKLQKQN
jgi:hypothetical protein